MGEKSVFKQLQPEIVVAQSNVFENNANLNDNIMISSKPDIESNVSIMNATKAETIDNFAFMSEEAREKYEYYSNIAAEIDFRSIEAHMLDVIKNQRQLKLKACKEWIEKKEGTCFKVTLDEHKKGKELYHEILEEVVFDTDPEEFLHYFLLSPQEQRIAWDQHCAAYKILYVFEKDGVKYIFLRTFTKKIMIIKPREYIYCIALRKFDTGDFIYGMQSYDDKNYPEDPSIIRGEFIKGGGYVKLNEDRSTLMTNKT